MQVLICGGRDYNDARKVLEVMSGIEKNVAITGVISGGATGADRLGEQWARERKIPLDVYPADWEAHGRAAGPKRNTQMLEQGRPDLVVAFPGGRGTADMVRQARAAKVPVVEVAS